MTRFVLKSCSCLPILVLWLAASPPCWGEEPAKGAASLAPSSLAPAPKDKGTTIGDPLLDIVLDGESLGYWLDLLSKKREDTRLRALQVLRFVGAPGAALTAEPVAKFIASSEYSVDVRVAAAKVLVELGPGAAEQASVVLQAIESHSNEVVIAACRVLAAMGSGAGDTAPELLALIKKNQEPEVKEAAAKALAAVIGPQHKAFIPDLIALLETSKREGVRLAATLSLGRVGEPAVPAFKKLFQTADRTVRFGVVQALGGMGKEALGALEVLGIALSDPDLRVRKTAAYSLGNLGAVAAAAVPQLETALTDPAWQVRRTVLKSLWQISPDAKVTRDAIQALAKDPSRAVRSTASNLQKKGSETTAAPGEKKR